jgi:asparagine synthase (glutamine-hydrolysing)
MCGIVAMFSPHGTIAPADLERGTKRLIARGPDGQKQWIASHGRAGLGHARLSIIDLRTGDQPIANEDGSVHIVVNGELYDYERIQRELEGRGHRLRTRSDSEIALHLYEELGAGCLQQLRGEFAFAIWDEPNQTLFAARDRFGIKPLFYATHAGTLYIASEVKALFAAGVPARWNRQINFAFTAGAHPTETMFDRVSQVPPGNYLVATPGYIHLHRYWDFDYPEAAAPPRFRDDRECAERLRDALDEAVRLRLRADVPVGCYLSGGLDSCAVLGLAARHHREPIRAFTLTFDREDYDEGPIAREMAALAGADFYPVPIKQSDLADSFFDATAYAEALCLNAHGVAKYILSDAVRKAGYKVVLTGEGSDEILGGYPHFRRDMLLYDNGGQDQHEIDALLEQLKKMNLVSRGLMMPDGETIATDSVTRRLGFTPSWMEIVSGTGFKLRALFNEGYAAEIEKRDPFKGLLDSIDVPRQLAGRAPVHQALYLWGKSALPNYILTTLGDRMEMAHSVEGRLPFLDHHVVELICTMPINQKIRGMTEKYVLREATRSAITDTVYRRQKHPFLSPPATLDPDGRLNEIVQDSLRGPLLASLPFFDQAKVTALLDRIPAMDSGERTAYDQVLMLLLSACALQDRYGLSS